jgi:trimethylamine--corrinoid protein Co-methyltransferase
VSITESETGRRPRREGGGRRAGVSGRNPVPQLPRRKLRRLFPPMAIVSADEIESIHHASLRVLSEIGMDFTLPEARDMLKKAGASVDGERVRFDPAMIEGLIASAPAEFTFHARNPDNDLRIGGDAITFGTVASPPNSADIDNGRRTGNQADYRNFLRLGQYFNCIGFIAGYPVEPIDIHASVRHLEALRDMVLLTDKPFHAYSLGTERIRDAIEIARLGRGISHEQLEREPSLFTIINTNSPLKLDPGDVGAQSDRLRDALHACRRHGARHGGGCAGRAECRGTGWNRLYPAGPQGSAGHLWRLHLEC